VAGFLLDVVKYHYIMVRKFAYYGRTIVTKIKKAGIFYFFPKSILGFHFWTFINVHFSKMEILYHFLFPSVTINEF